MRSGPNVLITLSNVRITRWLAAKSVVECARQGLRARIRFSEPAMDDLEYMRLALAQARAAAARGEVPVGCIIVLGDRILAGAGNCTVSACDPSAHAEIVALRAAAKSLGNYRLNGAVVYVTVEPCAMCAGAMIQARITRLVYGCDDPKGGAVHSCFELFEHPALNHRVEVLGGVLSDECAQALQAFFAARR
jgi:tRNA(Arg) A34 adenosine deaminase TadA